MYVVGYGEDLSGSDSGKDWWVKKFYSDGTEDTDWEQILDTGGLDDEALAVAVDGYNNVIVAGYSTDTDGSSGKDWRIVKYTSLGNVSWNKTYSIASSDDVIQDIVVDDDGNIYAAGYFYSSQSARDWHIKKLSSNGTEDAGWSKSYTSQGGFYDSAYGITIDGLDNIYVVGYMMSGNSQTNEWRIMRFSIDGILDSDWNFFQNINGNDIARSVDVSDNGEVYLGGYCNGGSGEQDWHIRKYYAPTEE